MRPIALLAALLSLTVVLDPVVSAPAQAAAALKGKAAKSVPKVPKGVKVTNPIMNTPWLKGSYDDTLNLKIDLLRQVPLTINSYTDVPETFSDPITVQNTLDLKRNILVHMEVLRRAYKGLTSEQQEELLKSLYDRYAEIDEDAYRFFDYGYGLMVMRNNKTGLFFLRKANERIKDQFSALAYGMAQAEADINLENSLPDQMSARKVNAIFMFKDAINRDAETHKPNFWPTLVSVLTALKPAAAYHDIVAADHSVKYVPYGQTAVAGGPLDKVAQMKTDSSCNIGAFKPTTNGSLYLDQSIAFVQGEPMAVRFYKIALDQPTPAPTNTGETDKADIPVTYRVITMDRQSNLVADFNSPLAPYIVEDIDGDGTYEFVIRQYAFNPLKPVVVYRYKACGFEEDKDVTQKFE